jgi:hypothetical protein
MAVVPERWSAILAEHEREVVNFIASLQRVERSAWARPPAPGKWSPAAVALHVCEAYALGIDAAAGGPGMRLRVAPGTAWLSRTLLLPVLLATKHFPRGAAAPREVLPDLALAEQLAIPDAVERVRTAADEAALALRQASRERPKLRVAHAYFGPLTPRATLRLLSAHTRHHARALGRQIVR